MAEGNIITLMAEGNIPALMAEGNIPALMAEDTMLLCLEWSEQQVMINKATSHCTFKKKLIS